jgi:RecB family exonuclease
MRPGTPRHDDALVMTVFDADDTPPPARPDLPRYESYSSLSTFEGCPQRYAYRYVERLPGIVTRSQYAFGSAIHAAFEAFVRARIAARGSWLPGPGVDALWTAFGASVDASGCTTAEIARYRSRAGPVLARFLEAEASSGSEPVGVELGFGVDVAVPGDGHPARFVGYIDRVDRRPDGGVDVVDYKTGKPRDQAEVDTDLQLTAYAFALARGGLRDPATGETLPAPVRVGLYFADPGIMAWTSRTPDQVAAFGDRLTAVVRRIREREFPARPAEGRCRRCEYRTTCVASAAGGSRETGPGAGRAGQ